MSDRVVWRDLGEPTVRRTHLRLAVKPVDAYTGGWPLGRVRVRLAEADLVPVENRSGYSLFLEPDATGGLPEGELTVKVDGNLRYRPAEASVTPSTLPPRNPVQEVTLAPSTTYPFPPGATLVRGRLCDETGNPIVGATVSLRSQAWSTTTNQGGEFVCFFTGLTEDDVDVGVDGTPRVVVNGDDPILDVAFDGRTHSVSVTVLEGATAKAELTVSQTDVSISYSQ